MNTTTRFAIAILLFVGIIIFFTLPLDAEENDGLLTTLTARVDELFGRVSRLEAIWEGPGPAYGHNGHCILAVSDAGGPKLTLQHETTLKHVAQFDTFPVDHSLFSVQGDPESGETLIFYKTLDESPLFVIERWHGCEFRGSSDWMAAEG